MRTADQSSSIQAAVNMETSRPDSPTERNKSDNMDSKSKQTAAESDRLSHQNSKTQSPVEIASAASPDNVSDSHHQAKIQEKEMAMDEDKGEELMKKSPIRHSAVLDLLQEPQRSWSLFQLPQTLRRGRVKIPATIYRMPWFPRLIPKVIYSYVVTGETFGAHNTIVEKVEKRHWTSTTQVESTTNVQECDIIIVFCPITTRVGSDVEAVKRYAAVSSNNKPVIVVLMHHTRDKEFSPGERKWFDDPRFVLEVHVLFHQTQRGLLQCAQNDQAVTEIQGELYRHSKS
ncbi:uncharacterized protein LOC114426652 [Parambassis ranga]|uniref:Uncharacterized protein LOC114426652 n=1 Tax=Parambassis ranga TaxID=210632 RepID=A0A6P7HHI6_9TELE|nr:uncharacterized protein LOC114426652 [Parambassis ranga]